MTYHVALSESAEADIREQARYLRGRSGAAASERWVVGLRKSMASLSKQPLRCPLAAESDKFPFPVREHYYGRRRDNRFRILFEIQEDVVLVLFVRHASRDEVEP